MILSNTLSFLSVALLATQVSAHAYISKVRADGGGWQTAQKSGASGSYRESSANTGWIGSKFINNNKGIVCGASDTPFRTVAAPGGNFFSDASQSAKQTLDVSAGGVVTVVTSGNPGEGFPHPNGHVQAWMARCGDDHDACKGFDASTGAWFKILAEKDGIQNTLRKHLDGGLNGQTYDINIPKALAEGSYILRFELIAFGQSSGDEGGQDQYYPFCNQVYVKDGVSAMPNYKTVTFPGVYQNGNIDQGSLPGPAPLELASGETAPPEDDGEGSDNNGDETTPPPTGGNCTVTPPSTSTPECASMCFGVKITEHAHLAPSCGASDVGCMCSKTKFHSAFDNCARDHCGADSSAGLAAFDTLCTTGAKMMRRAAKRGVEGRRARSTLLAREL